LPGRQQEFREQTAALLSACRKAYDEPPSPLDKFWRGVNSIEKSLSGKTMAGDDKKIKADPAPKAQPPVKDKNTPGADLSKAKGSEPAAAPSKTTDGETAASPSADYSRGEGQKPVSQAYKDNWDAIFAKKKKKR
jgi:hypothetical protein